MEWGMHRVRVNSQRAMVLGAPRHVSSVHRLAKCRELVPRLKCDAVRPTLARFAKAVSCP